MVFFFKALACIVCGVVLVGVGIYCAVPALAAVGGVIACCGIVYQCIKDKNQAQKERDESKARVRVLEEEERELRAKGEKQQEKINALLKERGAYKEFMLQLLADEKQRQLNEENVTSRQVALNANYVIETN